MTTECELELARAMAMIKSLKDEISALEKRLKAYVDYLTKEADELSAAASYHQKVSEYVDGFAKHMARVKAANHKMLLKYSESDGRKHPIH